MSLKPLLRWAGSKRKQIPILSEYWSDDFKRYVEPFAGSSCLFFSLKPKAALIADKNEQLIDAYETIRKSAEIVFENLISLPRTSEKYYELRAKKPSKLSEIDRATRFLFLNRNCFNGIFRTNLKGEFNVPFASFRVGEYLSKTEFLAAADLLKSADIRAWDFGTTLRYVKFGDFVYLDPPYAVESRRVFREYGAELFGPEHLDRLAEHLHKIHERGAKFVVSYADCRESRELGSCWIKRRVRVRRHIAGFGDARRSAYELLITNIE